MPGTGLIASLIDRCTFPPRGAPARLAVSGGADSVAMMVLAIEAGCVVEVHHVDHHIRPESGADAQFVADLCGRLGLPFTLHHADVPLGPNLEARLREARFVGLPADVLTGHTADDQVETILLNLMRGAGLDGLSGMREIGHPILRLRRSETEAVCAEFGVTPMVDASNTDRAFRRNQVRLDLIPLMNSIAQRDVVSIISRQAESLRDDADFLHDLGRSIDPTDAKALVDAPVVMARRALRAWLSTEHPPDAAAIERVLAVARGEVIGADVGAGVRVRRTNNRLRIESDGQ